MFITAVCVLFLIKLRWPKKKSVYDVGPVSSEIDTTVINIGHLDEIHYVSRGNGKQCNL